MQQNNNWKIATFILLLILIIAVFWFVLNFKMDESYVEGYNQGRVDIINLNSQGRFLLWNRQLNQTQELTAGNICSIPGIK